MEDPAAVPRFTWIPFYERLADAVAGYQRRSRELIDLLEKLRGHKLPVTPLEDRDDAGQRFPLEEIDPFTFFGTFNRGIGTDNRIRILQEMKTFFGLQEKVPSDFSGIPILNNMKSWFVAFRDQRKPDDVERLWKVFRLALGDDPLADPEFATAYDRALEVRFTNVTLTMGLFWIRPQRFVSLDTTMRKCLSIKLPKEGLSFAFYRNTVEQLREASKKSFAEQSYDAWLGSDSSADPEAESFPTSENGYWLVGSYWGGSDPPDQTSRFLAEGVWENGYDDRYLDVVKQMKPGDRIAIKSASTQQKGLPFDNRGKTISRMTLKARGTVVGNRGDGKRVEVEWEPQSVPRDWYFYTGRSTAWHLRKDQDLAQRLIRFAFFDEPQDHAYFMNLWFGESGKAAAPEGLLAQDDEVDRAQPYSPADMIAEGVFLSEGEIERALRRLVSKRMLILQGAPGVGKTFVAKKLAYALMEARDDKRVKVVQFHPSFSYEDFVRGYRPTGEAGKFELKDGPFVLHCERAANDPDRAWVLVIDEINRGNVSQIFGELFMLLETDKRGRRNAVTPLYRRTEDEELHVPENLFVIGTMNIADRSLALVDFALRRRFCFITLEPKFGDPVYRKWVRDRKMPEPLSQLIMQRLGSLNQRIADDSTLGPAFRIGHSFFCPRGEDFSSLDESWFRDVAETEIVPLIHEYWHDAKEKADAAVAELLG